MRLFWGVCGTYIFKNISNAILYFYDLLKTASKIAKTQYLYMQEMALIEDISNISYLSLHMSPYSTKFFWMTKKVI